jgi:hypothetical protein
MKTSLKVIACMAAIAVFVAVQSAAAQGKLQGVWKLTEVTFTGTNARTITPVEPGIWIFAKKHSCFVSVSGEKPRPALPQKDATDAQKVATWTQFLGGAASYEVKGNTLTGHPIIGKNPTKPGATATADFKVEGNTLYLTPKTGPEGPIANPYTLKMVRLE